MKRENYLKPQTARELLAMEQGICTASVWRQETKNKVQTSSHEHGFDNRLNSDANGGFADFTWE